MDYLRIDANKCIDTQRGRRLKEQFKNGINNDDMMTEIIRELTAPKKTTEVTSELVLCWDRKVEAQRAQKAILDTK